MRVFTTRRESWYRAIYLRITGIHMDIGVIGYRREPTSSTTRTVFALDIEAGWLDERLAVSLGFWLWHLTFVVSRSDLYHDTSAYNVLSHTLEGADWIHRVFFLYEKPGDSDVWISVVTRDSVPLGFEPMKIKFWRIPEPSEVRGRIEACSEDPESAWTRVRAQDFVKYLKH